MKYLAILLLLPAFTLFAVDDRLVPIHDALDNCAEENAQMNQHELLKCAQQSISSDILYESGGTMNAPAVPTATKKITGKTN